MSKIAVFDCDDVLANLRDPLEGLVSSHLKRPVSWKEWDQYDIGNIYNFHFGEICKTIVEQEVLLDLTPDHYALELLTDLKQQNYRIKVLTARGYHPKGREVTFEWLRKNNLPIDDVICVKLHENKRDYLSLMSNVEFYVEDNHHHAEQAHHLHNVKQVFLIDRPWNQQVTNVTRVNNLQDVYKLKCK